jgi:spoIIIJ-associated protein
MKSFISKIFGGSKSSKEKNGVEDVLEHLIEKAGLDISFEVNKENSTYFIELFGKDEDLLLDKDGALLEAFQLFLKRVFQNRSPEERVNFELDSCDFREKANQSLVDLAEKLKGIALDKGKPVYVRALPPKDRKIIHQYFAEDNNVKSKSIGDGHFKKIKIFPLKA